MKILYNPSELSANKIFRSEKNKIFGKEEKSKNKKNLGRIGYWKSKAVFLATSDNNWTGRNRFQGQISGNLTEKSFKIEIKSNEFVIFIEIVLKQLPLPSETL